MRLELKRKIEAKVKEQVFAALRQKALFVVPKSLVEAETQNMMQRMAADMREQGMKAEDIKLDAGDVARRRREPRRARA